MQGKQYIKDADINIKLKQGDVDKLYIEIICHAGEDQATAIISGSHTHFVYVERNGEVVLDKRGGLSGYKFSIVSIIGGSFGVVCGYHTFFKKFGWSYVLTYSIEYIS